MRAFCVKVLAMSGTAYPLLCSILLLLVGCGEVFELPPVAATSKYITYRTDADASVICMDDLLAREDRFIERTAALLGVDPPDRPIDFVWDPVQDGSEPWACPQTDCYLSRRGDDLSVVVSTKLSNHHELVHAIEVEGLDSNGHPTLREGLAEYLGSLNSTYARDDLPEAFTAMLAEDPEPNNYGLAMHFVGSIVARHGIPKYRALRAAMPKSAGPEEFAAVFEAEFGQSLDAALVEMSDDRVYGIDLFRGCGDVDASEVAWSSVGLIDAVIESACGDPWFHGGGFVDGQASFFGYYLLEVSVEGYYELTVSGVAGGSAPLLGQVTGCSFAMLESAVGSFDGRTGQGLLRRGWHALAIAFPPNPEARGEAMVRLEYVAPPS
jgi:hypothetical protein